VKRKRIQKKIESLNAMIHEHERRIGAEKQKSFPDEGCIRHWEKEIVSFRAQIEKVTRKGV